MKERLRKAMTELGVDAKWLSEKTGIPHTRINGLFNGEVHNEDRIGVGRILAIANALNVSVEWLYGKEEPSVSIEEASIMSSLRHLNQEGREMVMKYAELLDDSGKYSTGQSETEEAVNVS